MADMQDIVGKDYGTYVVEKYMGKNKSGTHTYKIRFKDTNNTVVRTRQSAKSGKIVDMACKKVTTKRKTIIQRKAIGKSQSTKSQTTLYGNPKPTHTTLILDQASRNTGWCVVGNNTIVAYGSLYNKSVVLAERIHAQVQDINSIVERYKVETIVVEDIYLSSNPKTYSVLANVIGSIMLYCVGKKVNLVSVPNPVWREYVGIGGGRTNCKAQSKVIATKIVGKQDISEDTADSICMAWWWIKGKIDWEKATQTEIPITIPDTPITTMNW